MSTRTSRRRRSWAQKTQNVQLGMRKNNLTLVWEDGVTTSTKTAEVVRVGEGGEEGKRRRSRRR